jgi:hypothetical protein
MNVNSFKSHAIDLARGLLPAPAVCMSALIIFENPLTVHLVEGVALFALHFVIVGQRVVYSSVWMLYTNV